MDVKCLWGIVFVYMSVSSGNFYLEAAGIKQVLNEECRNCPNNEKNR